MFTQQITTNENVEWSTIVHYIIHATIGKKISNMLYNWLTQNEERQLPHQKENTNENIE